MKKIQLIFSILAFMTASVGVFASATLLTPQYWEDDARLEHCNEPIDFLCDGASSLPCQTATGNNVYKTVDDESPCVPVMRPIE